MAVEFKYKQVIAVRIDIKMSKGKLAAQVGHAAVSAAEQARKLKPEWWKEWMNEGQCKIVVKAESEDRLRELECQANELDIPTALICDRGLTELPPGTVTCLGIGPAPSTLIDKVTGKLPLL
ncbi:MAG TPA: peptidyl-tRNA hydrolase [Candidatus Bathyarchaeota archaeon]|nr:peptidyl-tRNA hydrolase [Candidatus Bathyarchaeota archaeon]